MESSLNLRERTLAISHQFAKLANVFYYHIAGNFDWGEILTDADFSNI